ncbi:MULTISPECIES: Uma2 family endonuclease [Nostoc]|uniref:Uma2 family endonuclease n=1 Tax=Nostoc paludosum FACHB-159 TaxID=2692908 RepID=A0ABR8K5A0_9NOSO|nr:MULTISPECIES: Uma2 family endonuclease [Nostoc]MBD2678610.1 Uma2 family endonuclease [Nostoc sp. FACHB-857]MBD2734659.1 Uma2 family endonuclease [Nostoc paludosum FACHB-159]
MTIASQPQLSLDDFLKLPETEPASDFINGEIIQKPMPQAEHSRLQTKFCNVINNVTENQKIAYAFTELRCTFGGASIVPDVSVFRWDRIPKTPSGKIANRFEIHPDWAIEILSPEQNLKKVLSKLLHCSRNGTELGWLLDPEDESILTVFPQQRVELYEGADKLPIVEGIDLELTVEQVFAWLSWS